MISDRTLNMITHHEGKRLHPYRCPALLWTVGVGHVLYPVQGRMKIEERMSYALHPEHKKQFTEDEVNALLAQDLQRFEAGVARLVPNALGRQGRFDALVSFSFNVGLGNLQRSSVRMRANRGDHEGAADAFLKWNKAGGKVLRGLVNRRGDERRLYLS